MSSNFYHIDNLGEVFSITIESGFRQELFDNYDCASNGDSISTALNSNLTAILIFLLSTVRTKALYMNLLKSLKIICTMIKLLMTLCTLRR